jgi:hypothetical protein
MNDQRRQELSERLQEIERELAEISACKETLPCAPPRRQSDLLIEAELIEAELAELAIEQY